MAAADSWNGSRAWEGVGETLGANPLCLGAGCGARGRREPTDTGEGCGMPSWLCHTAPAGAVSSLLISRSVGLFPLLQNEVSNISLDCSYFSWWPGG